MRWLTIWSSSSSESSPSKSTTPSPLTSSSSPSRPPTAWPSPSPPAPLSYYLTTPSYYVTALLTTLFILATQRLYKSHLLRFPASTHIPPPTYSPTSPRSLFGTVTAVGDGDGFRLIHTPLGRLAGWGWFPGRILPLSNKKKLQELGTINVRIAGMDAPETAHFGKPAQRGGEEAKRWLGDWLLGRRVRCRVFKKDQYDRVVCSVRTARFGGWGGRDVGLEMLKRGLATVYEEKGRGAVFGGMRMERRYRRAEERARWWRRGVWAEKGETPREFKDRTRGEGG